jgi:hypothetical protein
MTLFDEFEADLVISIPREWIQLHSMATVNGGYKDFEINAMFNLWLLARQRGTYETSTEKPVLSEVERVTLRALSWTLPRGIDWAQKKRLHKLRTDIKKLLGEE